MQPPLQLLIYKIKPGKMMDFVEIFETGIRPLRESLGFEIEAAWTTDDNRFVWILRYDGQDRAEQDLAYTASPERRAFDPDPAQFIEHMEECFINPLILS